MFEIATFRLTMMDIDRIRLIEAVSNEELRATTAAQRLDLSRRQIDRLVRPYRVGGVAGLASGKLGQRHHQLAASVTDLAMAIVRQRYADFGPTLANDKTASV